MDNAALSTSIPWFTLVLPLTVLVGSILVSRILRLPLAVTVVAALLPLGLPFAGLPLSKDFVDLNPMYLIGCGWAVLLALAIGWVVVRPLWNGALRSASFLRFLYTVALLVALGVVGILLSRPELLNEYAPGWRGAGGLVLLAATTLSMSLALARALKAAVLFSLWAIVSVVLASELFLDKLPQEIVREDLRKLEPLIPRKVVEETIGRLQGEPTAESKGVKAVILGNSGSTGFPYGRERSLAGSLERVLLASGLDVHVIDATVPGATVYQMRRVAEEQVRELKPDIVLFVGWRPDSERGVNSYGLTGLSERQAAALVAERQKLQEIPFVRAIQESRLYAYARTVNGPGDVVSVTGDTPVRVSPSEYGEELSFAVRAVRESGATVVLMTEASVGAEDEPYRDAMKSTADREGALLVEADKVLFQDGDSRAFARGRIVSDEGYSTIARATARNLAHVQLKEGMQTLAAALSVGDLSPSAPQFEGLIGEQVRYVVRPGELKGDILVRIRALEPGTRFYRVVFSVNEHFVADRRLDSRDATTVRFTLPSELAALKFVELGFRTVASPPADEDFISGSQIALPVPISVEARSGDVSIVTIGEHQIVSEERFLGVSVDPRSGDVSSTLRSADPAHFNRWLLAQPWGSLVTAALRPGGGDLESARAGLRYSGVNELPGNTRPATLLGASGLKNGGEFGTNSESSSRLVRGSHIVRAYNRFLVEAISSSSGAITSLGRRM